MDNYNCGGVCDQCCGPNNKFQSNEEQADEIVRPLGRGQRDLKTDIHRLPVFKVSLV